MRRETDWVRVKPEQVCDWEWDMQTPDQQTNKKNKKKKKKSPTKLGLFQSWDVNHGFHK